MSAARLERTAAGTPYDPPAARAALTILALMALMVTYVETMVIPAFKSFVTFFDDAPTTTVVWIVSAYLLVGTVATPIFGKLGDKYGKKRILLVVMSLYAVAVSLAGFSPNIGAAFGVDRANQIYVLIGIRAFQGLGMGMFPLAFAMLPEVFPAARVGQAQGIVSAMFAAGATIGLVGGGYISYTLGWQDTYHTVIPLAIAVVVLGQLLLRESPSTSPAPIDIPGVTSLGFALATAMIGLTEGTYWGWGNLSAQHVFGLPWGVPEFFVLALVGTLVFIGCERRARFPVVSFQAMRQRNVWISNVNGVIVGFGMFLVFIALTILAEYPYPPGFGLNQFQMGLLGIPASVSMLVLAPLWGRWVAARGPKPVMITGFAVMGLGGLSLVFLNSNYWEVMLLAIPTLVGNVAVLIAMSNVIVLSVSQEELGIQTGMNQTFRNLGSAIGPVAVAAVTASFMTTTTILVVYHGVPVPYAVPTYSIVGFQLVFGLTSLAALVGLLLSLGLRNYRYLSDGTRHEVAAPSRTTRAAGHVETTAPGRPEAVPTSLGGP